MDVSHDMISLNQMKYIDIHCHLDSEDYKSDINDVLNRIKEKGIGTITIGTNLDNSKKAVEIAEANDNVWSAIGFYPEKEIFEETKFEELVKSPKVVAIGECGLEYFHLSKEATLESQKKLFEQQIEFALRHNKPLMLHIRPSKGSKDAYFDAIEILKNYPEARGNVHFFAGDVSIAQKFLDLGFTMSFTGVITFTHDYDEVIKYIPQNSIMSETDAPWVAPVPHRGMRNEPVYVIEVIKKMAEIRGENFENLNNAIIQNFKRIFLNK